VAQFEQQLACLQGRKRISTSPSRQILHLASPDAEDVLAFCCSSNFADTELNSLARDDRFSVPDGEGEVDDDGDDDGTDDEAESDSDGDGRSRVRS